MTTGKRDVAINKEKAMSAARKFVARGNYDRAIQEYNRIAAEDPSDVRVLLKIGDLYAKVGNKTAAIATYERVANHYTTQGFLLKAVAVYKQMIRLEDGQVDIHLRLAELYQQLGLISDSLVHFEQVASRAHKDGDVDSAVEIVRKMALLDPDNIANRIKLAELYSKENRKEDAIKEFTEVCDYLRKNNRQEDFIKVGERLLWHQQNNIVLCKELAGLYMIRKDPRRALQKLQVCFKANPRDVETLGLLAQAFQELNQRGKTVSVLKELARIHDEEGEKKKSKKVYEKILEFVPEDPDAKQYLFGPARAVGSQSASFVSSKQPVGPKGSGPQTGFPPEGDFGSADSSIAGELHADEIQKILTETDVYVKYGLHQKAMDHLQRIFELDPVNIDGRSRKKEILIAQNHTKEAIMVLIELAELSAEYNPTECRHYIQEAQSLDPKNTAVLAAAKRLHVSTLQPKKEQSLETERQEKEQATVVPSPSVVVASGLDSGKGQGSGRETARDPFVNKAESAYDELLDDIDDASDRDDDIFDIPPPEFDPKAAAAFDASLEEELDEDLEVGQGEPDDGLSARLAIELGLDDDLFEDLPFDAAAAAAFDAEIARDTVSSSSPSKPLPDNMEAKQSAKGSDIESSATSGREASEEREMFTVVEEDDSAFDIDIFSSETRVASDSEMPGFEAPNVANPNPTLEIEDGDIVLDLDSPAAPEEKPAGVSSINLEQMRAIVDSPQQNSSGVSAAGFDMDDATDASDSFVRSNAMRAAHEGSAGTSSPNQPDAILDEIFDIADDLEPMEIDSGVMEVDSGILEILGDIDETDGSQEYAMGDATVADPNVIAAIRAEMAVPRRQPTSLEDELEELDFFMSQGMAMEAQDIAANLKKKYPNNPLVRGKLEELQEDQQNWEQPSVDIATSQPLSDVDADTQYDLGIAYKDMGLMGEAIRAFQSVVSSPSHGGRARLSLAQCHRQNSQVDQAVGQLRIVLESATSSPLEITSAHYELALCYEEKNEMQKAAHHFREVATRDPKYPGIADKV